MSLGFVYVLKNDSMPGLVKIGQSSRDPSTRALELQTTGVPNPFSISYYGLFNDYDKLERAVHEYLSYSRHDRSREFFRVTAEEAVTAIRVCAHCAPLHEDTRGIDLGEIELQKNKKLDLDALKLEAEAALGRVSSLRVTENSLKFGSSKGSELSSVDLEIIPTENVGTFYRQAVKVGRKVATSRDGMTSDQGEIWHDVLMKAKMAEMTADPWSEIFLLGTSLQEISGGKSKIKIGDHFVILPLRSENMVRWEQFIESLPPDLYPGDKLKVRISTKKGPRYCDLHFDLIS